MAQEETNAQAVAGHAPGNNEENEQAPDQKPIRPGYGILFLLVVLLGAGALAALGILPRIKADSDLAKRTDELAAPSVVAIEPARGNPVNEVLLPGNVTAYSDSPIYARTSGYLTRWYYDIGAHVQQGALLAEIASPEIDQQLAQAKADLATAEATANNARINAERYSGLLKSEAVSKQDTDTFVNQAAATGAAVRSAQANVRRLQDLQSFEKVYAPFSGILTARNIDTGQLIDAGAAKELFHLQATGTLRVYTNLPQIYADSIAKGTMVPIAFAEYPGRTFAGKLVRTANAIDPASRTLLVELDVDNRKGELLPGSLAQVRFQVKPQTQSYILPVSVLIFRSEGLRVGTVEGNIAHLEPVTIGQDDGRTVQIINGLKPGVKVIQNPPDSLIEGEKVHTLSPEEVRAAQGGN